MGEFLSITLELLNGLASSIFLFFLTLLISLPLGLIMCFATMAKFKPLSLLSQGVVLVLRGTPLMLQIFVIFYVPGLLFGFQWPSLNTGLTWFDNTFNTRFIAALVAFAINYAAYFSEIFRGSIQAIPVGQDEAGLVLGLSKSQIFFKIKLLQMVKRIVPPMSNEILTLVKDTSLARIIALQEVIWAGQSFMKGSQGISGAIWPLFFTGVYYLVCNGLLTVLLGRVEKKLEFFR